MFKSEHFFSLSPNLLVSSLSVYHYFFSNPRSDIPHSHASHLFHPSIATFLSIDVSSLTLILLVLSLKRQNLSWSCSTHVIIKPPCPPPRACSRRSTRASATPFTFIKVTVDIYLSGTNLLSIFDTGLIL